MRPVGLSEIRSRAPVSRSRGPRASEPGDGPRALPGARRKFRLRHLLLLGLLIAGGSSLVPRARAAWELHRLGPLRADHAACLAGPLGPELLRRGPAELGELLRRRVVTSPPSRAPFGACAGLAERAALPYEMLRAHTAEARQFAEFGLAPASRLTSRALVPPTADLVELGARAWPFVRGDALQLVQPSSSVKAAPHPTLIETAGLGRGLPSGRFLLRTAAELDGRLVSAFGSGANALTFTSTDGGVSFAPGGRHLATDLLDRCQASEDGSGFSFTLTEDGRRVVLSHGPGRRPHAAVLAEAGERLLAVGCGGGSLVGLLVVASKTGTERQVRLRSCAIESVCADMNLPSDLPLTPPMDLARMGSDTVLALTHGGMTRVASSRDGGRTWTPWTLVYDGAVSAPSPGAAAPTRLLAAGSRLLLYSVPPSDGGPYTLLVSEDHGASFRAPARREAPASGDIRQAAAR